MEQNEVIVEIGSDGDELTLCGMHSIEGWIFCRHKITNPIECLEKSTLERSRQVVTSMEAALKLLDQYPWEHLHPAGVHPEFRDKVFGAVVERFKSDLGKNPRRQADWTKLCVM